MNEMWQTVTSRSPFRAAGRRGWWAVGALVVAAGLTALVGGPGAGAELPPPVGDQAECGPENPLPIPDAVSQEPGVASHQCVLSTQRVVGRLELALEVEHTFVGDIVAKLTHEDTGTSAMVIDRPGVPTSTFGCSGDNVRVRLSDRAELSVEGQCIPANPVAIEGVFAPNEALAAFNEEGLAGTWTLEVRDMQAGDTGSLISWALIDPDDDLDGCTTSQEVGQDPLAGGRRDPDDFWDFFDTPAVGNERDRIISAGDIARVVARFGASGTPGDAAEALSAPPETGYHAAFDRSAPAPGDEPWQPGPADGTIVATDILLLVTQFGHSCAGDPLVLP